MEMNKKPYRILVLDPNPLFQQEVVQLFPKEDFLIDCYDQLADAVGSLKETHYDCAIVDVQLPETPGYQAVPILKAISSDLPIILTAEKNTRELEAKVREQDIFYYYIKFFGSEELMLAVLEAVKTSSGDARRGIGA